MALVVAVRPEIDTPTGGGKPRESAAAGAGVAGAGAGSATNTWVGVRVVKGLLPTEPPGAQPSPGTAAQPRKLTPEFALSTESRMPVSGYAVRATALDQTGAVIQVSLAAKADAKSFDLAPMQKLKVGSELTVTFTPALTHPELFTVAETVDLVVPERRRHRPAMREEERRGLGRARGPDPEVGAVGRGQLIVLLDIAHDRPHEFILGLGAVQQPGSRAAPDAGDPFSEVRDTTESPFIRDRSLSVYTMNRAHWESRFYDDRYWERYFDMMAGNRFKKASSDRS